MTVLASIGLADVDNFSGKGKGYRLIQTFRKDKTEGKPKKEFLFLNLEVYPEEVEELLSVLKGLDPNRSLIKVVTIYGNLLEDSLSIPSSWEGRVFLKGKGTYKNITTLRKVSGTPNLMELYNEAKKYPSVRYYGGTLLEIEGVPVGRFDEGVAKEYGILGKDDPIIYHQEGQASYDFFEELTYSEVGELWGIENILFEDAARAKMPKAPKISIKAKKAKKVTKEKTSTPKKPKVKVNKKKDAFSRIFSEKVEF